jgi:acetolactate synthase-1/2/3 large subunit
MMTVSELVGHWLVDHALHEVFELSGGMIAHLMDAFSRNLSLRVLEMHHEQAAAFAACGLAQMRGKPAVVVASAGPGALNLVSGIAAAHYDSIPLVTLVGQVQTYLRRAQRPVRQWALQETEFATVAASLAKTVLSAVSPQQVPALLNTAIGIASGGRPGPVVVEIPFDVQASPLPAMVAGQEVAEGVCPPLAAANPEAVDGLLAVLADAGRPLVLVGAGVRIAEAANLVRRFLERWRLPVVATVRGLDCVPSDHSLRVGLIGIYGTRAANSVLADSDTLLVLGSRLDHGVTAGNPYWLGRGRRIIQVDSDSGELGGRIRSALTLCADLKSFLHVALSNPREPPHERWSRWRQRVEEYRQRYADDGERPPADTIDPNRFLHRLSEKSRAGVCVVDAGQHTWWSAQSYRLAEGTRFLSSPGLLAMGYGLPAAIGVAFGERLPVIAVVGDGGMQLQIQELQTVVRGGLPVKIVVMNNRCHGMVRQFQEEILPGRYPATVVGYSTPDFARLAQAYGIDSRSIRATPEIDDAVDELWRRPEQPYLLEVQIPLETPVSPTVSFGAPLSRMSPLAAQAGP